MLCDVCKDSLEGIYDPLRTKRLELRGNSSWFSEGPPQSKNSSASEAEKEVERYVFGHHETRASFLRSKAAGCAICSRYLSEWSTYKLGYASFFGVHFEDNNEVCVDLVIGAWRRRHHMVALEGSWFSRDGTNLDLSLSTSHETARNLILRWFSTCRKSHDECNALGINGSFMPTRILKVDRNGATAFFQLVDGTECAFDSAYMTLSYCWGSQPASDVYMLLKSTVEAMRNKQSISMLPKTIRDAMEIAGYFQVEYLWVDRLCIFQDSEKDFQREAPSMVDVYKNAVLNIAALGAQDAEGGCFFERNSRYVVPTPVHIRKDRHGRPIPYLSDHDRRWGWASTFETEPLVHRAWTVQERILARRVVYFGTKQIFWECQLAHWCETHLDENYVGLPDYFGENKVVGIKRWDHSWDRMIQDINATDDIDMQRAMSPRYSAQDSHKRLFAEWNGIVTSFSKCALSRPSDKIVALSGLANEMGRRLEELRPGYEHRYIAGLWKEELPCALSWRVLEPAYRAASYRAPTWSWASLDGPVSIPRQSTESITLSSLIAIEAEQPLGEAETGQVESASITLRGPILRAKFMSTEGCDTPNSAIFATAISSVAFDAGSEIYKDSQGMAPMQPETRVSKVDFDTTDDMPQDIFQLIVQIERIRAEGIVIVVSDDSCNFKRVGYFSLYMGVLSFDERAWDSSTIGQLAKSRIVVV